MRFAPGIRAKVLLASSTLLLIPWIGYAFVAEMEHFLREGQARMLADNARAVAALVQERSHAASASRRSELAPRLEHPIELDGSIEDWTSQGGEARAYGGERLAELNAPWTPQSLSFTHGAGRHGDHVYAFFEVTDDRIVYCLDQPSLCDHVRVSIRTAGRELQRFIVSATQPGPVTVIPQGVTTVSAVPIEGVWRERERGYTIELRLPAAGLEQLAFAVADIDELSGALAAVIVTEERMPREPRSYEVGADVDAILDGMARANLRIWLVDREGSVVRRTGMIQATPSEPESGAIFRALEPVRSLLAPSRPARFVDPLAQASRLDAAEVRSALGGKPASRAHESQDAGTLISAAAHPIEINGRIAGAALVEQTTETIMRMRQLALERLLLATLGAFVCGALILVVYVSHVSGRLRRLRDEAERAIDSAGRVRGLVAGSQAGDEIGDLSRSYSAILSRLAQYTDYLERLAQRLNHELRTPIAVVRSSLDNLKSAPLPEGSAIYLDRADAGLTRLSAILSRMAEASRLEEIMRRSEREMFDLDAVVAGCTGGYRVAYTLREIRYTGPGHAVRLSGVPDLIAQMLDKLVENANEYATPGTPIEVRLLEEDVDVTLSVRNEGPRLPDAMEDRLFESLVSVQPGESSGVPHLGLGLYIVRLIARFHEGSASARNRDDVSGVEVTVRLARYVSDPA
ncbi:MAG TPA: ATP-binding protein [Burkholderiales bacterium]|nr:ATP-binding protein [Burkholderiales bacterium]